MNISIVITQFLGIILTVMGLSVAIDRKEVSSALDKATQDRGFLWLWGFLILAMGTVIVVMNNVWTYGLPLVVTILGWLTLIKGAFLLLFLTPLSRCIRDVIKTACSCLAESSRLL